jgi:hypothetical protein
MNGGDLNGQTQHRLEVIQLNLHLTFKGARDLAFQMVICSEVGCGQAEDGVQVRSLWRKGYCLLQKLFTRSRLDVLCVAIP